MSAVRLPSPIRFVGVILIALLMLGVRAPAGAHAASQASSGRWVAIAYSRSTGALGRAWNYPTQASAEGAALQGCYKHAIDCRMAISTNKGHAALAFSRNGAWAGRGGATLYLATLRARDACNQVGGVKCDIKTTVSISVPID
jgi:hypothetical protein